MAHNKQSHPYHLVAPSPWPIITAFSAFLLVLGIILDAHHKGPFVLWGGIGMVLLCFFGWFRDIVIESKNQHNAVVRHGFRWGMILFILSEIMFFASFFWAYFNASLHPTDAMGNSWPPKGIQTLDPFDLPYLNTLLLLLSGTTVTWAHHSLLMGDTKDALHKTMITAGLGMIFLCVQGIEYHHAAFHFKDGIYPSTFFMATGFHGFHVLIGSIFLLVCCWRFHRGDFTVDDHFGFEAAAWYWHFVDVVWLFLFVSIYWWGSGT